MRLLFVILLTTTALAITGYGEERTQQSTTDTEKKLSYSKSRYWESIANYNNLVDKYNNLVDKYNNLNVTKKINNALKNTNDTEKKLSYSKSRYWESIANYNNLVDKYDKLVDKYNNLNVAKVNNAPQNTKSHNATLAIIVYFVLGVGFVLILSFVYFARRRIPVKVNNSINSAHCPRCGLQCTPKETKCKNCNTHF